MFLIRTIVGVALLLAVAFVMGCNTSQNAGTQVSDTQITAQVKGQLVSDVSASSLANIEVNTTNGIVTLAGEVETEEVKARAEEVARAVPGVVSVNNNLQVAAASLTP
jgi:hyperosmotically inducible protein